MKHLILFILFLTLPFYVNAQTTNEHTVSNGETLQSIATKYGVSISELRNVNSGLDEYVFAGMVLKIPTKGIKSTNDVAVAPLDDLTDIIYLKDGSELVAKILNIGTNYVVFEQYDTDDPFRISKIEITSIKSKDDSFSYSTMQKKKTTKTRRLSTKRKSTR